MTTTTGEVNSVVNQIPAATQPPDYNEQVEEAVAEAVREPLAGYTVLDRPEWSNGHLWFRDQAGEMIGFVIEHKGAYTAYIQPAECSDRTDGLNGVIAQWERLAAAIRCYLATSDTHDRPQNDLRYEQDDDPCDEVKS